MKDERPLKDNELRIRVTSSGICGTDIHIVKGESRVTLPVILGHEFGGVVEDVGDGVNSVRVGDLVGVDPNISCRVCTYCREGKPHLCTMLTAIGVDIDGGMSDLCTVPEEQAFRVPQDFDPRELPFLEPLSCVLHGLDRVKTQQGERVLIIGAGTIGLMFGLLLRDSVGELRVAEVNPQRLRKALSTGCTVATGNRESEFDVVIESSGSVDGFESAIKMAKRGGRILVFGVAARHLSASIKPNDIYSKELSILGSYVNPHTYSRAIELMSNKRTFLSSLDVKSFRLDDFETAFEASRSGRYSKVIFDLQEGAAD